MEMELPVYVIMVSHENSTGALDVIKCYKRAEKPHEDCALVIVENNSSKSLYKAFDFARHDDIKYFHYFQKNKSAALNFVIETKLEDESLLIFIDDDIHFENNFITKFYNAAVERGNSFYFGSSFRTEIPSSFRSELIPFLNTSAQGKSDKAFLKMKNLMFLGFSFAAFRCQWKSVKGFDERFGPGTSFGMGGQESVFQKKLQAKGFKPFFVKNNSVKHNPAYHTLSAGRIALRQESNGKSHGFQDLIVAEDSFKIRYIKKLVYYSRRLIVLRFQADTLTFRMKSSYIKGYFKALWIFLRIKDRKSYKNF